MSRSVTVGKVPGSRMLHSMALIAVPGSYFVSRYQAIFLPLKRGAQTFQRQEAPPPAA